MKDWTGRKQEMNQLRSQIRTPNVDKTPSRGRGYLQQYLNEFDFRYNRRNLNNSERTCSW
jgi:hypothetical protein